MKANTSIAQRAMWWMLNGETGVSSKTICSVMLGMIDMNGEADYHYPLDPGDFRRCKLLLDLIPEWRAELQKVAQVFPEWSGLVSHWDELEALYAEECERDTAPKLYRLMRELEVPA